MDRRRRFARVFWNVHRFLYRRSGGRIGRRLLRQPTLLLTTTGWRSGQPRQTPLFYLEDGDRLVVVASNLGSDRDPAWWLNLRAHPEAEAWLGSERRRVRARRASPEEAASLWPRLDALYSGYAGYRRQTAREIPVVILEPVPTR